MWIHQLFASRKQKMREQARRMGMVYYPKAAEETVDHLRTFRFMGRGKRTRVKHVLYRTFPDQKAHVHLFDLSYYRGDNPKRQTVFWIESNHLQLPDFFLRPEHYGHTVARFLGDRDIQFDRYPVFSRNYWVKGNQESEVRYLLHDDLLDYFSRRPGWFMEGAGREFILFKHRKKWPAKQLNSLMEIGLNVFDMILQRGKGRFL